MAIRIETGPFPGATYPNWKFTDIDDHTPSDQIGLKQALREWLVDTGLNDVSFRNDPGGAVEDQVADAIGRVLDGETEQVMMTLWLTVDTDSDNEITDEAQDYNFELVVKRL